MKNLRADEIDEQAQLFLAAVAADVDQALGAVVVDHVGVAAVEVIDDAEDALLVAGNDARAEHDGVAGVDVGMLVGVDRGAAEGAHGLALRAADHDQQLLGRIVACIWPGLNDEAGRNVEIAEVLRNFGALLHGAADDGDLAAVRARQFERDADAVDGRREAAEEELLLGAARRFRRGAD